MAVITTRSGKGSALTHVEMDANFNNLNDDKIETSEKGATVTEQDSATGAAQLPTGTTAQRPGAPVEGQLRRNSETGQFEGFSGTDWGAVGGGATGGGNDAVFHENDQVVTADYTITTGKNAMSAGVITIADGVTVTIPDGSTWSII
jgi:hypothetical protein